MTFCLTIIIDQNPNHFLGKIKTSVTNTMFYINDIFVLGGVSTVLFANYPGEVATAVEKLMRYLDHNVTGNSGMP